jgi:hypothetical protein
MNYMQVCMNRISIFHILWLSDLFENRADIDYWLAPPI